VISEAPDPEKLLSRKLKWSQDEAATVSPRRTKVNKRQLKKKRATKFQLNLAHLSQERQGATLWPTFYNRRKR